MQDVIQVLIDRVKALKNQQGAPYPVYGGHGPLIEELEQILVRLREIEQRIQELEAQQPAVTA